MNQIMIKFWNFSKTSKINLIFKRNLYFLKLVYGYLTIRKSIIKNLKVKRSISNQGAFEPDTLKHQSIRFFLLRKLNKLINLFIGPLSFA